VTFHQPTFPTREVNLTSMTGSCRQVVIPSQVESIAPDSFANFRELEVVAFHEVGIPRELAGFERCAL
jgi:hypothetical protein